MSRRFQTWPYEHNITLQWVATRTDRPWHHHQVSHCVMQVSNMAIWTQHNSTVSCNANRQTMTPPSSISLCHAGFKHATSSSDSDLKKMPFQSQCETHIIYHIRRHFFVSQTYHQECVSSYKLRLYFKHDKEYCVYLARHRRPSSKNGWWYNSLQFFCLRSNRMIDTVVALLPVSAIQWQQLPTMNFLSISAWMCSIACS